MSPYELCQMIYGNMQELQGFRKLLTTIMEGHGGCEVMAFRQAANAFHLRSMYRNANFKSFVTFDEENGWYRVHAYMGSEYPEIRRQSIEAGA